jgi:outer membrane protein assembly factor BamB
MSDASSPVCDGKLFLQAQSSGLLTCYDAQKGKLLWEKELEAEFWSSPTLVGKLVYLADKKGKTYLFPLAADKFELRGTATIGEQTCASPAFGDSQIYLRGSKHLFCIGKKQP